MKTRTSIWFTLLCLLLVFCTLLVASCNHLQLNNPISGDGSNEQNEQNNQTIYDPTKKEPLQGEPLQKSDIFFYGKNLATGNVAYAYNLLEESVARTIPATTVYFDLDKNLTADELHTAVALFASDHPECFWFKQAYSYASVGTAVVECAPEYNFTGADLKKACTAMDAATDMILSGLPTGEKANDPYEIALYLHDALAKHVEYQEVGYHQSAYGALVDGKAVCAGYAAAYQLLLQKAGISAYTVTGTGIDPSDTENNGPVSHAWNAVWLEKDVCVFTDVTWNDSGENIYHHYFNISFEEMEQDHTATDTFFRLASCNHTDYGYFDKNPGAVVNDASSARDILPLFSRGNERNLYEATLYYNGNKDFVKWFNLVSTDLAGLLGGYSASSFKWAKSGNEYHVQFKIKTL